MTSSHPHPPHHHEASSAAAPISSISPPSSTTSSVPPTIHPLPTPSIPSSVRLMCSYGGRILPRPGDHLLRYVGGETRMISLPKPSSFSTLLSLLSSLLPNKSPPVVKYQLPHEDLDSLISLSSDDDLVNMLEELDRLMNPSAAAGAAKSPRLRLFLFPASGEGTGGGAGSGGFGSVLSAGESNQWFLDALNSVTPLERRRSEASSSMLSDQPDYLTGIDTGSESPSLNDRSPVNPSDHTDRPEPAEPTVPAQPAQPAEIQTQPAQNPPVYYMPQPMPVYYVPAPMPYMQPSMDGRGPVPMHGFMPVPLDQILHQMGPTSTNPPPAGGYLYEPQPPAGGYLYEPQPPPGGFMRAPVVYQQHQQQVVSEPGLKPVNGGDIKGGGGGGRNV